MSYYYENADDILVCIIKSTSSYWDTKVLDRLGSLLLLHKQTHNYSGRESAHSWAVTKSNGQRMMSPERMIQR